MFSKKKLLLLILPVLFVGVISNAYGETESGFQASKIIINSAFEILKDNIQSNDYDSAKNISKFLNDYFGKNISDLRSIDPNLADEIHLDLLDLSSSLSSNAESSVIMQKLQSIENKLSSRNFVDIEAKTVSAKILIESDQIYQSAIEKNDPNFYNLSANLIHESRKVFSDSADLDSRLDGEIDSFFNDLESAVAEKQGFVSVGNLITAIQRDLLETETITINQKNLYDNIRELYSNLEKSLDENDYQRAEELAIEAYLENFEYLEPDIETVNPELLSKLEINMREELRAKIKNNDSKDEIIDFINQVILPDLKTTEDLVSQLGHSDAVLASEKEIMEMGTASEQEKSGVRNEIDFIRNGLEETLAHYSKNDYDSAYASARSAYLDSYESVEVPLRQINPDFTLEVEYQFAQLRNLINERADYNYVQKVIVDIRRNLDESERMVTGTGDIAPIIAFSSSFAVIFREGLESVLILGAILTYLEASRNTKFKPYIFYGIIIAIIATAITWFIASYIIEISGASRELVEAIAALSATAVLFYVSFWILNKIEHKKWMEFVKAKVWQASATGGVMVFVMLSFFTVYREGFETILFYQAMFGFAKYMEVFVSLGFILGIASLLAVYYGMRKIGKRLPLRVLFGLTMGIGAYLSIAFLGNAVRELQILDIVPYTSMIGILPRLDINMAMMTGIYPTFETLVSQLILLGVYLAASSYVLIARPRKEQQLVAMRKSRQTEDEH